MRRGFGQNKVVASYRDRLQPELLRFPGLWRTRILIGAGLLAVAVTALLVFEFGDPRPDVRLRELGALASAVLFLAACWPREIVCGPAGVEQFRLFGLGRKRIRWGDVSAIEERQEWRGLGAGLGFSVRLIAVVGGQSAIRHTPRHPDPERFLRECRMRMEQWQARHTTPGPILPQAVPRQVPG